MLSDLGLTVRGHDPTFWSTPIERADLYVIHWPEAIFWGDTSQKQLWSSIGRILTNLALLRARGTRTLWVVHNLQPHDLSPDRQRAWKMYAGSLSRLVDGWLTLSPSTARPAIDRYPALGRKRHSFIWHPPYADAYGGTRAQARAELGLPDGALVFGHAGHMRPHKNLAPLAAGFDQIAPDGSLLFLTGKAKHGAEDELGALDGTVRGLDYREGGMSAAEFDRALTAMDVFVAPYARFLHSGALVHALSRGCVVLAPRAPFTEDLAQELGADWVVLYDVEPDRTVLSTAAQAARRNAGQSPDLTALDPAQNIERLRILLSELGVETTRRNAEAADVTD
jgi:glycosyltransferase involved in cell wall biosynthesis